MRQKLDAASQQLDALSNYLAIVPRDPSLSLSAQIARDAAAGDAWAKLVVHSRALQCPQTGEAVGPAEHSAPVPSVAVPGLDRNSLVQHGRPGAMTISTP